MDSFWYTQMEAYLANQIKKCEAYIKVFERQGNRTMEAQFETYLTLSKKDLELLQKSWRDSRRLPNHKFEVVPVTCMPFNVDLKDRRLEISVKVMNLPVADVSEVYVIGEFDFSLEGKEETVLESAERWARNAQIEPKSLVCCTSSSESPRQMDMISSTNKKPFYEPESTALEFDRPMEFYIEKGRSRTFRRKFKPVKLIFYEKAGVIRCDRKIGYALVKIDDINDDASLLVRTTVMSGRKPTEALADVKVRVREPLLDKSPKAHEDKLLVLT